MWIILDVIIAVLFIICAVVGYKRGFIKSVFGIGVTVAAILITVNFSAPVAEYFRGTVVYKTLTDNLNNTVEKYVSDSMDSEGFLTLLEDAPNGVKFLLESFGTSAEQVAEEYKQMVSSGEENIAKALSDYIVMPASKAISQGLAVLTVFFGSLLVLHLAVWLLDKLFKLPVLHFANAVGGLLVGVVIGALVCFVFCTAFTLALPYLPGLGVPFTQETVESTVLYRFVCAHNPLKFLL